MAVQKYAVKTSKATFEITLTRLHQMISIIVCSLLKSVTNHILKTSKNVEFSAVVMLLMRSRFTQYAL